MSIETSEYMAMLRRMIRAAARRVAEGDEPELEEFAALTEVLDQAIADAVAGQREKGRSWSGIAVALGVTRQGAQQRFDKRRR